MLRLPSSLALSLRRFVVAAAMLLVSHASSAADLQWPGRSFQIVASEKPLPDLLRELAASQGTTAVVDPKITGVVSGKFGAAPLSILNSLCATYSLSWYYDGAFLYIDPSSDAKSEVMSIGRNTGNASWLTQTLIQLRIYDKRYPLLVSGHEGTARVTGPRRYVEMVRQAAKLMDQKNALNDTAEIRLFPLKYAWAGDFKITRSGKEASIPGVANVLRNLYGRNAYRAGQTSGVGSGRRSNTTFDAGADRQLKLSSGETVNAPKIDLPGLASGEGDNNAELGAWTGVGSGELPQFQADTRMNAVLIRDLPQRMAQYEKLIASMDTRPRMVEIEVTIMDISNDKLDSLGVDWRAHGNRADFQLGRATSPALTWNNAATEAGQTAINANGATVTPAGGVFTAAIGNALRNYLLVRVSALAQKGDANLIARPKVMTLDNNEAILENLSDFYVRVNGFQDAGLFKVTTGTSVRVTPLIVDEQSGRGVMMAINIEDGNIGSGSVDQIPIVLHRTVNTQALIEEGTSLLIAGYTSEEKSNATTGVPVLSNLPLVGNLFKYNENKLNKQERFYLLTPRLVIPIVAAAPGGAPLLAPGVPPMPGQELPGPPPPPAAPPNGPNQPNS
jgi:type III secretion protein C